MISERELVGLLYRTDWAKLSLSGTVTGSEPVVETVITVRSSEPSEPRRMAAGGRGRRVHPVRRAGQARFRAEGADGAWALGCDGARMWHWFRDPVAGTSVSFGFTGDDRPRPPYQSLLAPSWLLTDYSLLVVDGEVTVAGRAGVRVLGTPRKVTEPPNRFGGRLGRDAGAPRLFAPPARWLHGQHWDEVDAVVDAELGILLRCAKRSRRSQACCHRVRLAQRGLAGRRFPVHRPAGGAYGGQDPGRTARGRPAGRRALRSGMPCVRRRGKRARKPLRPLPGWRRAGSAR